jgi:hypothetical protein
MSDVKGHRRPNAPSADRLQHWSSRTIGSHRRGDITEPVSERVMAVWTAARLATLH